MEVTISKLKLVQKYTYLVCKLPHMGLQCILADKCIYPCGSLVSSQHIVHICMDQHIFPLHKPMLLDTQDLSSTHMVCNECVDLDQGDILVGMNKLPCGFWQHKLHLHHIFQVDMGQHTPCLCKLVSADTLDHFYTRLFKKLEQ